MGSGKHEDRACALAVELVVIPKKGLLSQRSARVTPRNVNAQIQKNGQVKTVRDFQRPPAVVGQIFFFRAGNMW